ncbi:hypothetical protein HPT29_002240 [Microvirga terrae]|uniref:Uncharacterized protein n=1 Tax=Microvirga terrae TaxID=2740529 RepID=A0ABY5RSJ5_9HYPH|nr:hypothetical protein [Microvirga terrae]UVF19993.1 hypothetical protein HPT29_002240 [Microvirga terrae]
MTKQEQFLLLVQTAILVGTTDEQEAITELAKAIEVSERIPYAMSAADAAQQFYQIMLAPGGIFGQTVPNWMA